MKLSELADKTGARLAGDGSVAVSMIATLQEAGPEDITFLTDPRYAGLVQQTRAAAVLVPDDFPEETTGPALLYVANVNDAVEMLLDLFAPTADRPDVGVHSTAFVDDSAKISETAAIGPQAVIGADVIIDERTVVGPGCVIGRGVRVGRQCRLWPNVVVNHGCIIGNNVTIYAGATIGSDGFAYRLVDGRHRKITHIGTVVIEDDVEIGANSCIDRAKFGRTVIGQGTKVDNLVQIAHNVRTGKHCILVSQVGIAGSSELGDYVVLAGQAGVTDHVRIGNQAMIGGGGAVICDVEDGAKMSGSPVRPLKEYLKETALIKKLPDIYKNLKELNKKIEQRASSKDHC